ncbi:cation:proton antiporter [Alterisphingorhabdus coralli]|uniref:Cation:proton antiporter n=1 Tax=Alterisphingorhabdus coralli TaxID=3071408 RepID=A0AA97FC89_9SPHN|nr:cation:proton antiporter [Parasphingorhabdus sp. SCSIO 66989]WOE76405.1 cation:proton antiporter [Parasphingorhabdus sp. SCSIO 66989]
MHPEIPYLREIIVFLVAAGLVVPLVRRFGVSPVLGFLFVGLVIGPFGVGRLADDTSFLQYIVFSDLEGVRAFAELGVVFLLFTIGLELSVAQLWGMRRLVFGFGGAQVVVSAIAIGAIAYWFGNDLVSATTFGLCLALSSTALVMQLLTESRRLSTPAGRSSFGVLLLQDLAVVPILFFVGVAGAKVEGSMALAASWAIGQAVLVIAAIFLAGRIIVRPFLRFVGSTGSREVFMAAVVLLVLGTSAVTAQAGLSMALGAFLAGLLFAGTEYRHQIAADIEPFKGLLLGLFFISVGMSLDVVALWADIGLVLMSVLGLMVLKGTILYALARAFRLPKDVSAETAVLMCQGGEFAFVVITAALSLALLEPATAQFVLLVVVVTMFLTPFLAIAARQLGETIRKRSADTPDTGESLDDENPVVIGGFGRVGKMLAQLLDAQRIPYIAIDSDPALVERERNQGANVYYGDASQPELLVHLGIENAAAFATTMDQPGAVAPLIKAVKETWPHVPIMSRARDAEHARHLIDTGAISAVPETVEASLELCELVLNSIGIPDDAARSIVDEQRSAIIAGYEAK